MNIQFTKVFGNLKRFGENLEDMGLQEEFGMKQRCGSAKYF